MNNMSFWKTFAVVFITVFVTNVVISYAWNIFFHESNWQWDITTITAIVTAAFIVTFISRQKKGV